jgi:hypothetical protein
LKIGVWYKGPKTPLRPGLESYIAFFSKLEREGVVDLTPSPMFSANLKD